MTDACEHCGLELVEKMLRGLRRVEIVDRLAATDELDAQIEFRFADSSGEVVDAAISGDGDDFLFVVICEIEGFPCVIRSAHDVVGAVLNRMVRGKESEERRTEELVETLNRRREEYLLGDGPSPDFPDSLVDEMIRELLELEARYPSLRREDSPTQSTLKQERDRRLALEHSAPGIPVEEVVEIELEEATRLIGTALGGIQRSIGRSSREIDSSRDLTEDLRLLIDASDALMVAIAKIRETSLVGDVPLARSLEAVCQCPEGEAR